eukprot:TRINITY_DN364_c0_g1_i20.p1 TRINITY_DN364_c0_g1~~TRINITY_DN364_c0_g1_i20.p1  ORF type:complete len:315 (-),score=44.90 TRINITY_DN364_c0_g1_i20:792-1736(-)
MLTARLISRTLRQEEEAEIGVEGVRRLFLADNSAAEMEVAETERGRSRRWGQGAGCGWATAVYAGPVRRELVDWMAELVLEQFALGRALHHACVRLLDAVMRAENIPLEELQLAAAACVEIAVKAHEPVDTIRPDWLLSACADAYDLAALRAMECRILVAVEWNLCPPTPYELLLWSLHDAAASALLDAESLARVQDYAEYFADIALQDERLENFSDSLRAASYVYNALRAVNIGVSWSHAWITVTGYSLQNIFECATILWDSYQGMLDGNNSSIEEQDIDPSMDTTDLDPDKNHDTSPSPTNTSEIPRLADFR